MTASTVSNLGDGLRMAALPLVALQVVTTPVLVSLVVTSNRVPWLGAPIVGSLVDRWDRRRVMVVCDALRAACALTLAGMLILGLPSTALLVFVAFALGVGEVFFDTAAIAMTPAVADPEQLDRSNARIVSGQTAANEFAGQPLGGAAVAVSPALPFLADALSFVVSAVLLSRLRGDFRAEGTKQTKERSVIAETTEGLSWLHQQRTLWALTLAVGVLGLASGAVQATLVFLIVDTLGGNPIMFGLILAGGAVGSLAGATLSSWVLRRIGFRWSLYLSLVVGAASYLALAAAPSLVAAAGAFAGVGATVVLWNVATLTARQKLAPDALLGRVQAAYRLVGWGAYPLGAIAGGVLVHQLGARAPAVVAAVALMVLMPLVTTVREHDAATVVVFDDARSDGGTDRGGNQTDDPAASSNRWPGRRGG